MVKRICLLMAAFMLSAGAARANAAENFQHDWLMMVTTLNTDPSQEAEFNKWYNTVDIPDVLEVPGYMRARRAEAQDVPGMAGVNLRPGGGTYVALYNIKTANIDKTIIHMLMASWAMEKLHHSTPLLKVTERIYFHQAAPAIEATGTKPPKGNDYLYLVRFDCGKSKAETAKCEDWYEKTYLPAALKVPGFVRAIPYRLYWVLMDKPVEFPGFMTVFEIRADAPDVALKDLKAAVAGLASKGEMNASYAEKGSAIYLKIKDVKRP